MRNYQFEKLLNRRIESIRKTLESKGKEYATADRLYNFKRASEISQTTPEKALFGMLNKHLVSVIDLIEGRLKNESSIVEEKIGDAINYLILLEAILEEQRIGSIGIPEDVQ